MLVIGAGAAGLTAARKAAEKGLSVLVVEKGSGATIQSSGAIDVVGYLLPDCMFASASQGVRTLASVYRRHPYSIIGGGWETEPEVRAQRSEKLVREALRDFVDAMRSAGVGVLGSLDENILVTNFVGTFKLTSFCLSTIYNGNLKNLEGSSVVFVGVKGFPEYDPKFCADSFRHTTSCLRTEPKSVDHAYLDIPGLEGRSDILQVEIARRMDDPEMLRRIGENLQRIVGTAEYIALPTAGFVSPEENIRTLEEVTGATVFELPSFPPSVPGYRLVKGLEKASQSAGVSVKRGYKVVAANCDDTVKSVRVEVGRKTFEIEADTFVLATGGFLGGGLREEGDFLRESIFNLPVYSGDGANLEETYLVRLLSQEVFPGCGHELFSSGIRVNENLQPVSDGGEPVYSNLYAAGSIISGYNYMTEKSGMGVALTTGYLAGLNAASQV